MLIWINRIRILIIQNFCIFLNKLPQFAWKRCTGNLRLMHSPYFSVYGLEHRLVGTRTRFDSHALARTRYTRVELPLLAGGTVIPLIASVEDASTLQDCIHSGKIGTETFDHWTISNFADWWNCRVR